MVALLLKILNPFGMPSHAKYAAKFLSEKPFAAETIDLYNWCLWTIVATDIITPGGTYRHGYKLV
jgi:hypothetical protein